MQIRVGDNVLMTGSSWDNSDQQACDANHGINLHSYHIAYLKEIFQDPLVRPCVHAPGRRRCMGMHVLRMYALRLCAWRVYASRAVAGGYVCAGRALHDMHTQRGSEAILDELISHMELMHTKMI